MTSEEFSHSDSYKGYVNSILQSVEDRSVPDPVWGSKIPSNYEELRQHCLQFVDKYSTTPTIQPKPIITTLEPYKTILPTFTSEFIKNYRDQMISEVRMQKFRELCQYFQSNADISLEVAQEHCDTQADDFSQEVEPFGILSETELANMCLSNVYAKSEHHLYISSVAELITYFPYMNIASTTTNFVSLYASIHKQFTPGVAEAAGFTPPLVLTTSEQLDAELQRLATNFSLQVDSSQNDLLYSINKLFISTAEKSVTWNILCINDQISDPAASSVQFKLFAARAHINTDVQQNINYIPPHRQLHFVESMLDSYSDKVDEILCGEESFLHVASAQVVHQHITEITRGANQHNDNSNNATAQKQSGIIKMKFLRAQMLRQTIISTVNWMISTIKGIELDQRDATNPDCLNTASILFQRDLVVESKQFPHCIVIRNPSTSHNVIYEETLNHMERIRNDLLNFGSFYIRKWEKECGSQIDRKSIVEDLYECENKYQNGKKQLIESLLDLYNNTFDPEMCKRIYEFIKYVVFSRPLIALDVYDYFMLPFDMNTNILKLQAEVISSSMIKTIDDLELVFNAVKTAVSIIGLKQNTLNVDAFLNLEFIIWTYVRDFCQKVGDSEPDLTSLIENINVSMRLKNILMPGSPQTVDQAPYYAGLQGVRFEVIRSVIIYRAYLAQCEVMKEDTKQHLQRTLFAELTSEEIDIEDGMILAVDEVKESQVELAGEGLDIVNRLQSVESSLLDAIVAYNFTITEAKIREAAMSKVELPKQAPSCYSKYFSLDECKKLIEFLEQREYLPFQSIFKLKANIRESLQVLNLNAGSHFDELLNAQQKQTSVSVQFLQNRARLPDVMKILALFEISSDRIPSVYDGYSLIESVQPSMRREKARGALEFYSFVILLTFLSYHASTLDQTVTKIHKHQRKNKYKAPHLQSLLEETNGLQNDAQKTQAAKTFATDLLIRINVACIESGIEFGRSYHEKAEGTAPPILDISGNWTISAEKPQEVKKQNIMKIIEEQLDELSSLNISLANMSFIFFWNIDNEQRKVIKKCFDTLSGETNLVQRFRQLRQKILLIRLLSSPTFSSGEICEFPSPFNHLLLILDNILDGTPESLRFVLIHLLIQRCIKRPKSSEPVKLLPPPVVTEKSPFLADVDSLPQETKSETLHPALAQFIEQLQLHSTSDSRNEIKISQFHVNQALLKFSQSISQLFDSSLVQSHKAFLALHTMLFESKHRHDELFRKRVQAINQEARTFNRKLQTALADRSHTVGYEINLLQETLKSSKFDKKERQEAIRRKLKEEYTPQVREMTLQLFSLKHNLEQYQKNLQHEIEGNMFEIKKQSISQLLRSQNLPDEVKDSMKQAFDFDDALHELMETKSELSSTVFKLKAMRLLQDLAVRSDFQVKLKKIEEQREMVKQENNEFSKERDVKEAALKQQYTTVMQSVRAAEKEVEKLRRELELENKNRSKLREWRTKHEKRVAVLEKKLQRLTEWSKYKPDKLIFQLDLIEKEIERRKRAKERGPALLEKTKQTVDRELKRCQAQLKAQENAREALEKETNASAMKQNLTFSNEIQSQDLVAVMEENSKLKEENEQLQQRLAELSLQIAAVSQINIGGIKIKASRLDQ
ncbi:hypothetical protein TVAG_080160 [Trichomonas vaginalis G3]|uniref:Uncharacterized protein n=1 Tax=Trichomonas vaginalis (strain ATCC PRA-98 / G3) TaxID=412133 RepID=A2FBG9_TRIV3|nr:coiled-coil domain-containing protein 162 family [Trichomonas vaginalis G3]EAX97756.1 hypothetical protein TVAG_080160 [Trichomonas vaginalis G3]KAI5491169.1 coiled-coil domain-containing protein 162 family [Trichomonas vaginalis G3]|eukprot:XP_001310686.1 hypothetical protein [Trichomonas vaginalis G3]